MVSPLLEEALQELEAASEAMEFPSSHYGSAHEIVSLDHLLRLGHVKERIDHFVAQVRCGVKVER